MAKIIPPDCGMKAAYKTSEAEREYARTYYAENKDKRKAQMKARYEANKDQHKAYYDEYRKTLDKSKYAESERAGHYRRKYSLTVEEYDQMLAAQNGRCAGCSTSAPGGRGRWHIDHDHQTGAVRGLLCFNCNHALGCVKDSVETLMSLAAYLLQSTDVLSTKEN